MNKYQQNSKGNNISPCYHLKQQQK